MRYILFLSLLLVSCKTDLSSVSEEAVEVASLLGEWEVYLATRNGKVTKSADKSFITFQADNIIKSNLFTMAESHTFTYDKNKVVLEEDELVTFFNVKELNRDTLRLETKVQSFKMEFFLKKKQD